MHVAIATPHHDPTLAGLVDELLQLSREAGLPVVEGRLGREALPRVRAASTSATGGPWVEGGRLVEGSGGIVRLEACLLPGATGSALGRVLMAAPAGVRLVPGSADVDVHVSTSLWLGVCGAGGSRKAKLEMLAEACLGDGRCVCHCC